MGELNIQDIKSILPHRYPFLLVDKILECVPGQSITAIKNVTYNEPFFQGHFPEIPIMPGVLIVEAMAQSAALLGVKTMDEEPDEDAIYFLVGIDKVRFKQTVGPGDQLKLQVNFITVRRNVWKFAATASVNEKIVASAELLTTVMDKES
jgi:3-hydroxyacyl-[acyl-carrier-protein] dehydratase